MPYVNLFSETMGKQIGNNMYDFVFQVLVDDLCTPSYTNRGGVGDNKGDGTFDRENKKSGGQLYRKYDSDQCKNKCGSTKVKYIVQGNPEGEFSMLVWAPL